MSKIALQKVWTDDYGKTLYPDGDPKATTLVAPRGLRVSDRVVESFDNHSEFFAEAVPKGEEDSEVPISEAEKLVTIKRIEEEAPSKPSPKKGKK